MSDDEWKTFFQLGASILADGPTVAKPCETWCAWTTFRRLTDDAGYWTGGFPKLPDIANTNIQDGGVWMQPFSYSELAHIIIPRRFRWESAPGPDYATGTHEQNVDALSEQLITGGILHRLTDLVLEIKLY